MARAAADPEIPREVDHERARRLPRARLRAGAADRAARRAQAPAGPHAASSATAACTIERYWKLDYAHQARRRAGRGDLRAHPRRACSRPPASGMIADVPLGAFLSGGIDSSAVVAAMAQPVRASRCARSRSASTTRRFDELPHARADRAALRHRARGVPGARRGGRGPADASSATTASRSPTPRRSRASTWRELTRRHVTVALNGDGGDESFAGYQRYVANALAGAPRPRAGRRCAGPPARCSGGCPRAATSRACATGRGGSRGALALDAGRPLRALRVVVRRRAAARRSTRPSSRPDRRQRAGTRSRARWAAGVGRRRSSTRCSRSTSRPTSPTT